MNIKNCPRFTRDEEAALCGRMRAGDADAREQLILSIVPLAISQANSFYKHAVALRNSRLRNDDLVGQAFVGAIKGVDSFDPSKGRLTTNAAWKIRSTLSRLVRDNTVIHIPEYLFAESDGTPGMLPVRSTDTLLIEEMPVDDQWRDDQRRREDREEAQEHVGQLLQCLPPHELDVIKRRFWDGQTLKEIGRDYGVTRERIRQIEKVAIERMRKERLAKTDSPNGG